MTSKLPQEMTMQELDDFVFLVVKANYPNMRDEGVEVIMEGFYNAYNEVDENLIYWEV